MIKSFRHKGLAKLFETGQARGVRPDLVARVKPRVDALHVATKLDDLSVPGWDLHSLKGESAGRYAVKVNGPWRLTFAFRDGEAHEVDLEQYH